MLLCCVDATTGSGAALIARLIFIAYWPLGKLLRACESPAGARFSIVFASDGVNTHD
jgi:hypothetical protein